MDEISLEKLKYPIGRLDRNQEHTPINRKMWIKTIKRLPKKLNKLTKGLSKEQLATPYRPDGWTVRQVVNHLADSHVNSYIRFRWALTEDTPIIKAYDEKSWAELSDAKNGDIKDSITILKGIHARWVNLLEDMSESDFQKELAHPEWKNNLSLSFMLSLYAWHCDHHLAHIKHLIKREGW